MPRGCANWCSKWTTTQAPCSACTDCTASGCYRPSVFPNGIAGSANPGFQAVYGELEPVKTGVLELSGNSRGYLVVDQQDGHSKYKYLNLLGKTLRFTADVSRVPCSVNAALYFVQMEQDRRNPEGYCDIQTSPSCTEIDVFEANQGAIQATIHTQRGLGGDGTCNRAPFARSQCAL